MAKVNRRQMLGMMGGAMAVGLGVGALSHQSANAAAAPAEQLEDFGWKPNKLDVAATQAIAHENFYHKGYGCGYGAFYSIVGQMSEKYGSPYKNFPYYMMEMGKSGFSEWGTLCGALVGAAAALSMFWGRKDRDPMVDELFRWYELTAFPIYKPRADLKVGLPAAKLPTSVSDSVLCHISVSRWSYTGGLPAQSKERSERCARLTADVAKKTVEIMNAKIDGNYKGGFAKSKVQETCTTTDCHGGQADKYQVPNLKGKMDCTPCHTGSEHVQDKRVNHP